MTELKLAHKSFMHKDEGDSNDFTHCNCKHVTTRALSCSLTFNSPKHWLKRNKTHSFTVQFLFWGEEFLEQNKQEGSIAK